MKQTVTVAGFSAEPGTIVKGQWPVAESYDGSKVEIPVAIVNGIENGPRVWVQCSVHGDEYVGTVAVQELLSKVDPGQVAGALVVLPWSNPLAFRSGTRMAPQDGMDMNRVYPGKPLEQAMHLFSHTEIVVDKLFNELKSYDLVLDLHDGGYMGRMSSYIQYFSTGGEVDVKSRAIAFASGMDIIWESPPGFVEKKAPGSVGTITTPMGIPTLTVEIGGEGRVRRGDVERMYLSLENMLKHMKVLPGEIQPHGWTKKLCVRQGNWLRPQRGGVFVTYVEPGQQVEKGTLVADVRDPFGKVVEQLLAPKDGVIIGLRTYGTIASGQYAGNVAEVVPSLE